MYLQSKAIFIILLTLFSLTKLDEYFSNSFKESIEHINNPDQGFYRPLIVRLKPDSFSHGTNNPEQVYHLRCDISQFSGAVNSDKVDKKLTDIALNGLDNYLYELKKQNKNAVIRFCYDPNYEGKKDQEPSLTTIETHIKQLSEILNKHIDTLTAIEAGMLGPWGEMHSSKIATEENKAKVFKYWLQNTKKISILARTTKAIFTYFGKTLDEMEQYTTQSTEEGYLLGMFNDCYLSTNIDTGTYVYDRTRETNWLSTQNDHLPYGGETCAVSEMSDLEICLPEMFLLGLSYLNIEYHSGVIEKWKNLKYEESLGADLLFYGMNGFDYIKRHLGYRLLIKSINVNYEKNGNYEMKIKMRNVGFGNMWKPKKIDVIFADMNDKEISRQNVGEYHGEMNLSVKGEFLSESNSSQYKVYLSVYGSIEDNVAYYPIQFANEDIYNKDLKGHFLFYVKNGELIEP